MLSCLLCEDESPGGSFYFLIWLKRCLNAPLDFLWSFVLSTNVTYKWWRRQLTNFTANWRSRQKSCLRLHEAQIAERDSRQKSRLIHKSAKSNYMYVIWVYAAAFLKRCLGDFHWVIRKVFADDRLRIHTLCKCVCVCLRVNANSNNSNNKDDF